MPTVREVVEIDPGPVTALPGIELDVSRGMFGLPGPMGWADFREPIEASYARSQEADMEGPLIKLAGDRPAIGPRSTKGGRVFRILINHLIGRDDEGVASAGHGRPTQAHDGAHGPPAEARRWAVPPSQITRTWCSPGRGRRARRTGRI